MSRLRRKLRDDEMLVSHPPPAKETLGQEGEERRPSAAELAGPPELEDLRRRLGVAADSTTRRSILATIQERFGNAAAEAAARDAQRGGEPSAGAPAEE